MNNRYDQAYEAARLHYVEHQTMQTIADKMSISRSTVSRLLSRARDEGIVTITLAEPRGSKSPLAVQIAEKFAVTIHVVNVDAKASANQRFAAVAAQGAHLVSTALNSGMSLGVGWGVTASQVALRLEPRRLNDVKIVQLNGANLARDTGLPYAGSIMQAYAEAFNAKVISFPVPAFFDYPATREAMWRERSIKYVLDEIKHLDMALFGVGAMAARVPSHVYSSGYLLSSEIAQARAEGAIGDVCTVLLRSDGSWRDISLNMRASGPNPDVISQVPRRICVVGDPSRALVLLGALRANLITDLVCDDQTLKAVYKGVNRPNLS